MMELLRILGGGRCSLVKYPPALGQGAESRFKKWRCITRGGPCVSPGSSETPVSHQQSVARGALWADATRSLLLATLPRSTEMKFCGEESSMTSSCRAHSELTGNFGEHGVSRGILAHTSERQPCGAFSFAIFFPL